MRKSWKDSPCYLCSDMSWSNDTSSEKIIPIHRNDTVVYYIPLCVEEGTIVIGGHCVVVTYNIFYFTITVFIINFATIISFRWAFPIYFPTCLHCSSRSYPQAMYPRPMENSQTSQLVVESNHLINVDEFLEENKEAEAAAKERRDMQCCNHGRWSVLDPHCYFGYSH